MFSSSNGQKSEENAWDSKKYHFQPHASRAHGPVCSKEKPKEKAKEKTKDKDAKEKAKKTEKSEKPKEEAEKVLQSEPEMNAVMLANAQMEVKQLWQHLLVFSNGWRSSKIHQVFPHL